MPLIKNHCLRCWDCLSLLNWIGYSYPVSTAKTKRVGVLIRFESFFFPRLRFNYINLQIGLVWKTILMSGLMLVIIIWVFPISSRNRYVQLFGPILAAGESKFFQRY